MSKNSAKEEHYVLVGAGLQNGLIALALLARRPRAHVTMIERESAPFGDHTWSFHDSDVPKSMEAIVAPLPEHTWDAYEIIMPGRARLFRGGYNSLSSDHFAEYAAKRAKETGRLEIMTDSAVESVDGLSVHFADGSTIEGDCVVDARGPEHFPTESNTAGYQKFVGVEMTLSEDHRVSAPILMDARVDQIDGYRFVYTLPYGDRRVLLEDTYFSDDPEIDVNKVYKRVLAYAKEEGYNVEEVIEVESGSIPLPCSNLEAQSPEFPLMGGYGAGWFHPATGYSFPTALRLADYVSSRAPDHIFGKDWATFERAHISQFNYCAKLNLMLFTAFAPEDRWNVFDRFHRLPTSTIERFYALSLTSADRLRILAGRPPKGFSIRSAIERGIKL